jgi:hypothetical protein
LKFGFIEEKKKLDVQCQHRVVSTNSSSIYSDVRRLLLLLLLQTSVNNQFSELLADLRLADLEALFFCNFSGNSSQVTYSRHGCSGVLSSFAFPICGNSCTFVCSLHVLPVFSLDHRLFSCSQVYVIQCII